MAFKIPFGEGWCYTPAYRESTACVTQVTYAGDAAINVVSGRFVTGAANAGIASASTDLASPQLQLNPSQTDQTGARRDTRSMPHRMQRIVVTGGAGFIGSHLVDRLLRDDDASIVVLDNLSRGKVSNLACGLGTSRLELVQGDVREAELVEQLLRGADVVYHLAAESTVMGAARDTDYAFETNVTGTYNLLRGAARAGVGKVIFVSSCEVYGEPISLPVNEDSPLLAINTYGATKVAGEALCRAFRRELGLQVATLRLSKVYGPRDTGRVIPLWIAQAAADKKLTVYGGKQVIDFVGVAQVVEALVRVAELEGPRPPINVGSGTGTRIIDVARRLSRLAGRHGGQLDFQPARPMEVTRFVASTERMRQYLGLEPPLDSLVHLSELIESPAAVGAAPANDRV